MDEILLATAMLLRGRERAVAMGGAPDQRRGPLADRLEHLFCVVHPKHRGPYTPAEVATAVNDEASGPVISSTYVWQLRTGRRDNPTQRHLSALADFFGVSPLYFFGQEEAEQETISPELAIALQDEELQAVALRAAGLSERALRAIREMIENARVIEGLDSGGRTSRPGS